MCIERRSTCRQSSPHPAHLHLNSTLSLPSQHQLLVQVITSSIFQWTIKMQYLTITLLAGLAAAQALNIPTRVGNVEVLKAVETIKAGETRNYGYRGFDRGMACTEGDTSTKNAVFLLEEGATLENVIIGPNAFEGVHCKGKCTVRNVWFRDVCEDPVAALGKGDVLVVVGGAQNADDKVVQHNGSGRVTIRDYQVINVGKVYRACGDCELTPLHPPHSSSSPLYHIRLTDITGTNNSAAGSRHVAIERLRATNVKTYLAAINTNFGGSATISASCGTVSAELCQQFKGVDKGQGKSDEVSGKESCLGAQGKLARGTLNRC